MCEATLILESNHIGREFCIGSENPFAVMAGFLLDPSLIDDDIIPVQFEIFSVALVADKRLGSLFELLLQRLNDQQAILFVLPGLLFVQADDIPAIIHTNLFDLQRRRTSLSFRMNLRISAGPG
jgi:hypothetical protein